MTVEKLEIKSLFSEEEISQTISDLKNNIIHAPPCDCPSCEHWIYQKFTKSRYGPRFKKKVFLLWWIEKKIKSRYPNLKRIFTKPVVRFLEIFEIKSNYEYELFTKFEETYRILKRFKKSKIIEKNKWQSTRHEFSLAQKIANIINKMGEVSQTIIRRKIQTNKGRPVKVESIDDVAGLVLSQNVLFAKEIKRKKTIRKIKFFKRE